MNFHEFRAYDKAAIEYNGREAVTNFVTTACEGGMVIDSNNAGTYQFDDSAL